MKFRSEIEINSFPFNINFENRILFIGSCFSDNIGRFFLENRFNALVNPFGTLFNPFSIATALKMALNPSLFNEEYLVEHDGLWHSFVHHGRFSNPDKQPLIQNVQKQFEETRDFLLQTDYLFITFVTIYCYRYLEK
ncbi:MAG: GSCFA domain-containing protein, partial [Bacteroidales bacterium]|nr:GSCFA domain-containing protein [Bacteroidales bacterium]